MASLNTLRTKFGFVLSIIIGLALLAFIFSLRDEMGFAGKDPTVGVIAGEKIHYSEYYQQYDQIREQSGQQENSEEQSAMLSNAAWQALFNKYVLLPGFEQMGLRISEEERLDIISGRYPTQAFYNAFADPRTGEFNVLAIRQFLAEAETNPQAQQMWLQLIEQARTERLGMKYLALLRSGVHINPLEVAIGADAANKTFAGRVVAQRFSDIADSLFKVSSSEIKAYYKKNKNSFRQLPSRTISYVVFEVDPTDDDMLALEKSVAEIGAEFAATDQLRTFVRTNRNGRLADNFVGAAQLAVDEAEALMAGRTYGPVLKNNQWTMSRVYDSKIAPDTLGIRHIVLPYTQEALADSLLAVLKAGGSFAATAYQYSVYEATAANGGEVGLFPFSAFTGEFATALGSAKKGDIVKVAAGDAIQLIQIYRADKPSKHIQIASIIYPIEASAATRRDIHSAAGQFLLNAKGSVEAFNNAAAEAIVTPRVATISQGERTVRGLDDSRDIVRWAYGAKKGAISEVFQVDGNYVIAILTEIDDNEFTPVEKVASQIRSQLMRDKKFDYIVARISGSTLEEKAASLGAQVAEFEGVTYNAFYIDGVGVEPRLIGAIATTQQTGVVSAPVKGMSGVYIFKVDDIQIVEKQTAEAEMVRLQAMIENMVQQFAMPALQQMSDIKDLRGEYF